MDTPDQLADKNLPGTKVVLNGLTVSDITLWQTQALRSRETFSALSKRPFAI